MVPDLQAIVFEQVVKTIIWLQDKAQADEKAEHTNVCEHFEKDCNAVLEPKEPF
jgi:hypothetical protein